MRCKNCGEFDTTVNVENLTTTVIAIIPVTTEVIIIVKMVR